MSRRSERLEDQIRTDISTLLQREATDPRLSNGAMISITDVELTEDLRYARVYVSILGSDAQTREAFAGVRSAAGFVRRELARRLRLRYVPELAFHLDTSVQHGARIQEVLKQLEEEAQQRQREGQMQPLDDKDTDKDKDTDADKGKE